MKAMSMLIEMSSRQTVYVSDHTFSLWQKWNESGLDSDWEAFADSAMDGMDSYDLEFYIEDASPAS